MKRQFAALAALVVSVAALSPLPAAASTVRADGQLVVPAGVAIPGNAYLGGFSVDVDATTTGDLVAAAYDARVSAPVAGDLTLVAGSARVSAPVAGDLRVIGGLVTVDAPVSGDLVVVGGEVEITSAAKIGGDLVVVGGLATFRGDVRGVAKITAGQASVDGVLGQGGDVTAAREISFGAAARAGGLVSYFSPLEATVAPEASALSSLLRHNRIPPIGETGVAKRALLQFLAFWYLLSFVSNVLLGLAVAYGARVFAGEASAEFRHRPGRSFVAGLAVLVLLPAAAALAVASLFALPVGILAFLAALAAAILAAPLSALVLGRLLLSWRAESAGPVGFREVAVGAVALALLGFVPQVGFAVKIVLGVVAVGAGARVLLARAKGPSALLQALEAIRGQGQGHDGPAS